MFNIDWTPRKFIAVVLGGFLAIGFIGYAISRHNSVSTEAQQTKVQQLQQQLNTKLSSVSSPDGQVAPPQGGVTVPSQPMAPVVRPPVQRGQSQEDIARFGKMRQRCQEQAQKRAAIHGVPVESSFHGDVNGAAGCHIDAMVSEHGAI